MADEYKNFSKGRSSPPERHLGITPDDNNDLADTAKAFYIGGAGNISINDRYGATVVYAVLAGQILPFRGVRVNATGTTATNIIAWFE